MTNEFGSCHNENGIFAAPQHGGRVYQNAKLRNTNVRNVLDFSASINPIGPPHSLVRAVEQAIPLVRYYPDTTHEGVKHAIAARFHVEVENLMCANGASEVIDLLLQSLQPKRVVILEPAFSEYRQAAKRHGIPTLHLPLEMNRGTAGVEGTSMSVNLPLRRLNETLDAGDLLFVNTPHNPTGVTFRLDAWISYAHQWMDQGITIAVDESFLDFFSDEMGYTAMYEAVQSENLFVIRSATKFYAMPGLRFGFAVGSATHFQNVERLRDPWSVNQLAQVAAQVAYKDVPFQRRTWEWLKSERLFVQQAWDERESWTLHMGEVNFFLLRFHDLNEARSLEQHLQEHGMFLRDCSTFMGLGVGVYRVAMRTRAENAALQKKVSDYFGASK